MSFILHPQFNSKKQATLIALILALVNPCYSKAQSQDLQYKNRINAGAGSEDAYLGFDYSRDIYKSKLFLGIGAGLGTGLTLYTRYEPVNWKGLSPFISSGISNSVGGTLIVSRGASSFSASAGLNYLLSAGWSVAPVVSLGASYYYILTGQAEEGVRGFSPLIKIGVAFPKYGSKTQRMRSAPASYPD